MIFIKIIRGFLRATDELIEIITHDASVAVLASAGAGKTELLAQKASYLFYTNNCAWPKRILSLTFKTEAQLNIKERINKRCGDKASRFDSFTFHAFSKSIVDRFKNALPDFFKKNFFLLENWQWLGILILVFVAFLVEKISEFITKSILLKRLKSLNFRLK